MITLAFAALVLSGPFQNPITGPLPYSAHLRAGAPGYQQVQNYLVIREGYAALYSAKYKTPLWSQENLTADAVLANAVPRTDDFKADPDIPAGDGAQLVDYRNSGFDRGHMTPSADVRWESKWFPDKPKSAQSETFYLSNMVPQDGTLNRGMWASLEGEVRNVTVSRENVQVITGPIFGPHPRTIGPGHVSVPDKVFKIIVVLKSGSGQFASAVFILDNKAPTQSLSHYRKTIDDVERATGLDFFASLPDNIETRLEAGQLARLTFSG